MSSSKANLYRSWGKNIEIAIEFELQNKGPIQQSDLNRTEKILIDSHYFSVSGVKNIEVVRTTESTAQKKSITSPVLDSFCGSGRVERREKRKRERRPDAEGTRKMSQTTRPNKTRKSRSR